MAYNTLALRGGGCLGKGQAVALMLLAQWLGVPLWRVFAHLGGTSVGAIIGALLATDIPPAQINAFFDLWAPKIFSESFWKLAVSRLWDSAKYNPAQLEKALQQFLGDRTLADCKCRLIMTAKDMNSGRNVFIQSYGSSSADDEEIILGPDSGIKLWEAARGSAAAQNYLPGFKWKDLCLWDGGNTQTTAPDMLLYTEARQFAADPDIRMLSLGCGQKPWPFTGCDMADPGVARMLAATIEVSFADQMQVWLAKEFLGSRHVRLNPVLAKSYELDDASAPTRAALAADWSGLMMGRRAHLTQFLSA